MWNLIGKEHTICDLLESQEDAESWSQNERNNIDICAINSDRQQLLAQNEAGSESLRKEEHRNEDYLKIKNVVMGIFVIFIIVIAACYFFGELILGVDGSLHKLAKHLPFRIQNYLSRAIAMGVVIPLTMMSVVSLFRSYRNIRYWSVRFTSSDYLLFLTTIANFIGFILEFIACASILSARFVHYQLGDAIVRIIWAITAIIQVWVQTQLLLASRSLRRQGRSISKLTKICLIYTIALNVAMWLLLAISRDSVIDNDVLNPALKACFGEVTTRTLVFMSYPAFEVYRFHSAIVAFEILK